MLIRRAHDKDKSAIWRILEPTIRAGETYALPPDMSRPDALEYWLDHGNQVFVSEENREVIGTYYLRPNYPGGGHHVANCGYMTAAWASGMGIGSGLCAHSIVYCKAIGYRAIQFNLVVSTNERAVKLWQTFGFDIVGRLPGAFQHPRLGYVEAYVMFREI